MPQLETNPHDPIACAVRAESMSSIIETARYAAHPKYRLLTGLWAGMAVLFLWQLRRGLDTGTLLFLLIALGLTAWYGRNLAGQVTLEERHLRLQRPFVPDAVVEFRQLASVGEEGRFGQSILLHYHPLRGDGLLELDEIRSLALPALVNQAGLMALLTRQVAA